MSSHPSQASLHPSHPQSSAVPLLPLGLRRVRRTELPVDTISLARFLIGKIIVRELPTGERLAGRIVETEAYPPRDPAAHHFRGPTPRNRSMFLRRGHAYVYFSYGNHFMLNVSAELPGIGGGVLIRALQPLEGLPQMQANRAARARVRDSTAADAGAECTADLRARTNADREPARSKPPQPCPILDLARGPGRLAAALEIDRSLDGVDLCAPGPLWLAALKARASGQPNSYRSASNPLIASEALFAATLRVFLSPRIGITRAARRLLRFFERGNPFVSGPSRLNRPKSPKKGRGNKTGCYG